MKYICLECKKEELIQWYNKFYCLNCKKLFEIDEILKKLKDINQYHWFKIINEISVPDDFFSTLSLGVRKVECPLCGYQFKQRVESGCFGSSAIPFWCKKCNYPESMFELRKKLREMK